MKFKVGDKVLVKANSKWKGGKYAGRKGQIEDISYGDEHPYRVVLKDYGFDHFHGNELELV